MLFTHMTPRTIASAPSVVFLALVLASGGGAIAQEKTQPRAPARSAAAKPVTTVLTPAELRDCLNQRDRLHRQAETALAAKVQIAAEMTEIGRVDADLANEKTALDRTSEEAVNAFNVKVRQQDTRVEAHQAKVKSYNAQVEEVQATRSAYGMSACENRRYDERDLEDLKRKK